MPKSFVLTQHRERRLVTRNNVLPSVRDLVTQPVELDSFLDDLVEVLSDHR